ncbi:MAG: DEAD/DEAH box helicase [Thermodesulfobacteriota bacterium]|jgi:superfamily II DNA or RNA helicase
MQTELSLKTFLEDYGESLAEKATKDLKVIHDPARDKEDELDRQMDQLHKNPFPAQREIIKAIVKSFRAGNKAVYMTCEMGCGKTLMAIAVASLLKPNPRVLVICPPHLVRKWIQEIKEAMPWANTINLNGESCFQTLENLRKGPMLNSPEFYIIGKEKAKLGYQWRPAVIRRKTGDYCPKCGQILLDQDGVPLPVFETNTQGKLKKKYSCQNVVTKWKWSEEYQIMRPKKGICGEQLWQPDLNKRNYLKPMPAHYIKTKLKGVFDLLIADECHQYKNQTGQGWAFAALANTCKYTICLTGTLTGGYAQDIFYLLYRTHPKLMVEDGNPWGNPMRFMEKYGILERITTVSEEDGLTTKAKKRTVVKAKPGISPLLLGKTLLPNSVFLRLSDCVENLVPYEEEVYEIEMSPEQAEHYQEFEEQMRKALKEALAQRDNSLLGSYLNALLSYPERIYRGIKVLHPHTKELVAEGPPVQGIMPKEQELLDIIEKELRQKRKVLLYIQNSNTTDISPRLTELIEKKGYKTRVLRAGDSEGRDEKIRKWVSDGLDVLICNPKLVEVGLDLLFAVTVVFYQSGYSTYTLRQASRRSWRIPQTQPVKVYFLTYADTMQTRAMKLIADKLTCSLALEGELTDKGLAALSETSESITKELAKMLVEKSQDNRRLKDLWAAYRKKEVQLECQITEAQPLEVKQEEVSTLDENIKKVTTDAEQIGTKVVKVQFIEYSGRRRKKVTHIEVTQAELKGILDTREKNVVAQFSMF